MINGLDTPQSEPHLLVPLLLVEGDMSMQLRMRSILRAMGYDSHQDVILMRNLDEAQSQWKEMQIALALVNLDLPDGNGLLLVEDFYQCNATFPIIVITGKKDEETILEALKAGASGYLLNESDDVEIIMALRSVINGGAPIDPIVAQHLINILHRLLPPIEDIENIVEKASILAKHEKCPLTRREVEILNLVSKGLTNRQIGDYLNVSRYTVGTHIKHIYRKLTVRTRIEAVNSAQERGWLPPQA